MRNFKVLASFAVAFALVATTPVFAQHGDHDKDRHEDKGKDKVKHEEHRDAHEAHHAAVEEHHAAVQERRAAHEEHRAAVEEHHAAIEERHEARRYGRITDEHYRLYFGHEHHFRIVRPVIVAGHPRFQYGGYWFVIGQPLPPGWRYSDDVYVDYVDGGYYMFSPVHPRVRIVLNIL